MHTEAADFLGGLRPVRKHEEVQFVHVLLVVLCISAYYDSLSKVLMSTDHFVHVCTCWNC